MTAKTVPYGSWHSPVTADLIVAGSTKLSDIALDGDNIYWLEMRPAEAGRHVIVRRGPDGHTADVTPADFNARTRVHEYGGGPYTVSTDTIYFANFQDQRLYRQASYTEPHPVTPFGKYCYADGVFDRKHGRTLWVREDHGDRGHETVNSIVSVDLTRPEEPQVLISGKDFYAAPRISPDGASLAWLSWNHPHMPWDSCELWVARIAADGTISGARPVAGGNGESVCQPEWSPDGTLYFVSDRSGFWNLYRLSGVSAEPLCPRQAEFGRPHWVFGYSTYAFASDGRLVCAFAERGIWSLGVLDTKTLKLTELDLPYSDISYVRASGSTAVFRAGSPSQPQSVVKLDLDSAHFQVLRRSNQIEIDPSYISGPEPIEFPTTGGATAHAFYYAPRNRDFQAPAGTLPPLLVKSHGGPTSQTDNSLKLEIQFWTSRGFAVADVNYRGSTGFGSAYRRSLDGLWGVADVDDCANAALFLARRGDVDPERLAISGGSAGGYTTLCALTFRDVFKAGASYYGVSDLQALARDTHKFEARYLDSLVAPWPDQAGIYEERSPVNYADRLSCPVIFFQGTEDLVVPPDQTEAMVEALKAACIPVAYLPFAGEQHGFRKAENIKRALTAELFFYSRIFGFKLAEAVEPVKIYNLEEATTAG